jgi:hypothetical protein
MIFQAGGPDGPVNALAVSGRWVALEDGSGPSL